MTPDAIASFLAPKGPLARAVARFEPRAGQVDMAQTVGRAIESGGHVVIEAGTGTGKTFGYLVPALLAARGPVVVATATRTLQDQIFETDLPRLLPLFPGIKAVRLKGRANYLCPFRMKQWVATVDVRVMTLEERLRLRGLIDWSSRTVEGDLAEFHDLSEEDPWRRSITSTRENCLGRECPDFVECPFNRVRLAAMEAGLIVTNHHLLLADLALKEGRFGQILPEAAMVVVDEAHNLPPLTSVVFGDSVSTWQTRDLIGDLRKLGIEAGVDEVVLREADRVHQATEEVIHAWPSGVEEGKEEIGLLRERLPKLPGARRLAPSAERSGRSARPAQRGGRRDRQAGRAGAGACRSGRESFPEQYPARGGSLGRTGCPVGDPTRPSGRGGRGTSSDLVCPLPHGGDDLGDPDHRRKIRPLFDHRGARPGNDPDLGGSW